MLPQTNAWAGRVAFPEIGPGLGAAWEYWDLDPSTYQGWEALRDRFSDLGRKRTRRELAYELAQFLLDDVVVAAGGIEHALQRLREAVARAQAVADAHIEVKDGVPTGLHDVSTVEAWYEFANLLAWARAFEERLDRRPPPRTAMRNQGLVPALKPKRMKKRVLHLLDALRGGPVGESRLLANYTLHGGLVRNVFSGARVGPDGAIRLPIPDRASSAVHHWYLFTWRDDRDGVAFAGELWASVVEFMDELLDAFERATPRRLRAL